MFNLKAELTDAYENACLRAKTNREFARLALQHEAGFNAVDKGWNKSARGALIAMQSFNSEEDAFLMAHC